MELFTVDNDSLMTVDALYPKGSDLIIEGQIMGALPVRAVLTPEQARSALKLLQPRTLWFLLTILFRSGGKKALPQR